MESLESFFLPLTSGAKSGVHRECGNFAAECSVLYPVFEFLTSNLDLS